MAIYYTSSTAIGSGTGSYANPWTLQQAFDGAVAGDEVRILNDGTYLPTTRIDIDTNRGTSATAQIKFRGRKSDDTAYERATISGASIIGTALINFGFSSGSTSAFLLFDNLRFTVSPVNQDLWAASGAFYQRSITFIRCSFDNAGRYAFSGGFSNRFIHCEFFSNSALHLFSVGSSWFQSCFFKGAARIFSASSSLFFGCVFTNCGDFYSNMPSMVAHCTFDGKGSRVRVAELNAGSCVWVNNIFANYTGTVLVGGSSSVAQMFGNLFHNVGSSTDMTVADDFSVTGDPLFTNTTDGSENYVVGSSSPAISSGQPGIVPHTAFQNMTGYMGIGALLPLASGTNKPTNPFTQTVIR